MATIQNPSCSKTLMILPTRPQCALHDGNEGALDVGYKVQDAGGVWMTLVLQCQNRDLQSFIFFNQNFVLANCNHFFFPPKEL